MLWLSEMMLQHHEVESFSEIEGLIAEKGKAGEMFFRMDVKPTYPDTPDDWEDRLESAFNTRR